MIEVIPFFVESDPESELGTKSSGSGADSRFECLINVNVKVNVKV